MKTLNWLMLVILLIMTISMSGCNFEKSSDRNIQENQEKLLKEANAQCGIPAIVNFREKKILKDIIELRDQEGLLTYTYVFSEMTGMYRYLGPSIGYGISSATQYTSPQKMDTSSGTSAAWAVLPQADPNGLFSPSSAEGTWIMMYDPINKKAMPQYIEQRISVFTYKLPKSVAIY